MSELPTPIFPPAVDSTMLSAFDACPQKFYTEFILRLAPSGTSIHLQAGGAFARACEVVRREVFCNNAPLSRALGVAFEEFARKWHPFPIDTPDTKNFVNTWAAVVAYFSEYPPAEDVVQPYIKQNGEPAVEFTFSFPLPIMHPVTGDPILYAGRFDMLGDMMGMIAVVDEKTTGSLGAGWSRKWDMRGQFLGYIYGAREFGYDCESFIVRGIAIQKTQIPTASLGPVLVEKWRLQEWYETTLYKVEQMVQMWKHMEQVEPTRGYRMWPKSFGDACSSYNGCPFISLCTNDQPHHWYADYQERIWNPAEKNPTEGSPTQGFFSDEPVVVPEVGRYGR